MSTRFTASPLFGFRVVPVLLAGCAGVTLHAPAAYAQTVDSATNGCLRNPSCYITRPGEEAIIPGLSRAVDAARTATTMAMVLQEADIQFVERTLTQCAQAANEQVNKEDKKLQGQEPTREQCQVDPAQVAEWLQLGLKSKLWGSLVPDLVLHASRNPNQVQRIYDFKFPCPPDKGPSWGRYPKGHPHHSKSQKQMYKDALLEGKREPGAVTIDGIK